MSEFARNKKAVFFSFLSAFIIVPVGVHLAKLNMMTALPTVPIESESSLDTTLVRSGFDPEALTAVGVIASQVPSVVSTFKASMDAQPTLLSTADAARAVAKRESDQLRRLIQSGKGEPADVTEYQAQMADLAQAQADTTSALQTFAGSVDQILSSPQLEQLARILGNRSWKQPTEFLILDRDQTEWVAIRDALANERISAKYGRDPDPAHQAALLTWRSQADVALAITRLESNLAEVEAAWKAAVTP